MKNCKSFLKKAKITWIIFFTLMFFINIIKIIPLFNLLGSGMGDYSAFYLAEKIIISGQWAEFYNLDIQSSFSPVILENGAFLPFYHLPYEALLLSPLATFPYLLSYLLWDFINLILLFVNVVVIFQLVLSGINIKTELNIFSIPVLFITALAFSPVFSSFVNGQDSILLLTLLLFSLKNSYSKRHFKAGLILGLAIFKPHLTIPIAIGIGIRSGKNFLFGFFLSSSICVFISILMIGFDNLESYFKLLNTVNAQPEKYGVDSATIPNIRGFFERQPSLSDTGAIKYLSVLIWMAGLLIIAAINRFLASKCLLNTLYLDSITIVITLLCSIHVHGHDFVLLLFPLFISIPLVEYAILKNKLTILQVCKYIGLTVTILSPFPFNLHVQIPNAEIINILLMLLCVYYFYLLQQKLTPLVLINK